MKLATSADEWENDMEVVRQILTEDMMKNLKPLRVFSPDELDNNKPRAMLECSTKRFQ
jgi:phosphoketolase